MNPSAAPVTRIPVERRFPLGLRESIASIRELYESGKQQRWDPVRDIDWNALSPDGLAQADRDAARSVWSRRAWVEYTGIAETPALLIRFCLEADREADPKYFLSVRNTEEAWHVEAFHRTADRLGGYLDRPADRAWEPVFNQRVYREALDADRPLDDHVAVHCAVEDGLELELFDAYRANARHPVIAALLERVVADKRRHASFGWLYLESRLTGATEARRAAVAAAIAGWIANVAYAGYHIPTLSETLDASAEADALRRTAAAGLGAVTPEEEERLFTGYLGRARERLASLGVVVRLRPHARLGAP